MRLSLRATKNWASTPPKRKTKPPAPMDKVEFRYLCAVLKIVDNETAEELLGPSWRSCQRYWYGELSPPDTLARLLRLAAQTSQTHDQLRKLVHPVVLKDTRRMPPADL